MGYRIDVNDLTLDQMDDVNRLVESGRAGKVTAVAFIAIKAQDPTVTLAQVRALRQSDIQMVPARDPAAGGGEDEPGDPTQEP